MNNDKETNFHKSRIAFMIINEKIEYLANSTFSHEQWYKNLGLPIEQFETIVRGYIRDQKAIFYRGDFICDDIVIETAKKYGKQIQKDMDNYNIEIYAGVEKGEIGTPWKPKIRIYL